MKHYTITLLAAIILCSGTPAWATKASAPQPSQQAVEQKEQGNRYFESGLYIKAAACYTRAIDAAPAYFEAYYNRGLAWQSLKLYYKAIVDFDRALEFRHNDPDILYYRGLAYEATGQFGEALADMQSASSKGSGRATTYLKNGELKRKARAMKKKAKSIQAFAAGEPEPLARSTRTTLRQNAYGGQTTTTVFTKGDPLYDGPEGIFKQINHYNKKGSLRRSVTFHHALFSAKNDRNKTISHFDENGIPTLVEHHLTGHNLGKVTLFHYSKDGTLAKSETVTLSQYQEMEFGKD